jgi:hypothetical protein
MTSQVIKNHGLSWRLRVRLALQVEKYNNNRKQSTKKLEEYCQSLPHPLVSSRQPLDSHVRPRRPLRFQPLHPPSGPPQAQLLPSACNPDRPHFPENDRTEAMPPLDGGRSSQYSNRRCTGPNPPLFPWCRIPRSTSCERIRGVNPSPSRKLQRELHFFLRTRTQTPV